MSCLATALLTLLAAVQDPGPAPPSAESLIERFARLDRDHRSTVVRNMERHLQRLDDYVLQGVLAFERGMASYPERPQRTWFAPAEYAPGAAARHLVARTAPAHAAATARMRPLEFLPDLLCEVEFDWQLGKAVRNGVQLDDGQRFANFVHGYPPGADHAVAGLLELLHTDAEQRLCGWYFDHLYADRMGAVFADVPLFDAWNSGAIVEVPDTDAIAFARRVLQTGSFTAPIPADRRRERLYRKVREGFAAHREYRSLRLAAAASFFVAEPKIDPTYEPLVRRCHWLWVQTGGDPARFAARLAEAPDRTTFLQQIDESIRSTPEVVGGRQQALRNVADYLRALAEHELEAAGG